MQQGSIIQTVRKQGPNVWSFRWSEKNRNGRRVYRKRVIGTIEQYPTPTPRARLLAPSWLKSMHIPFTTMLAESLLPRSANILNRRN
jgi:hypothetical protein